MKKLFIAFAVLALTIGIVGASDNNIKVLVSGEQIGFPDQGPLINQDDRTLVPIRFISQALGAKVEWNDVDRIITIYYEDTVVKMEIGANTAYINGVAKFFDTVPEIINGRAMVPLRFITETLGAKVEWQGETRTIIIATNEELIKEPEVKEFKGLPYIYNELPTLNGVPLHKSDKPGAQVMYAIIDDLPIKIGEFIIYDIEIEGNDIKVKQYSSFQSSICLHMLEDGYLARPRSSGGQMDSYVFTYNYPIVYSMDDWNIEADKFIPNNTDLRKVSHFAFDARDHSINPNGDFRLLLIENPLYEG